MSLQAQGKEIFNSEMAREKAGDCKSANSTSDFDACFQNELIVTNQNLNSFEVVIREMQSGPPEAPDKAATDQPGAACLEVTPEQQAAEFDRVEQSWQQYRQIACTAAFHQFDGGTGAPSFEMQCELKLARDHMRELDMIYGEDLHL